MTNQQLLPGVTSTDCPPLVVCDAHSAIRRARFRAVVRDSLQVALILAVDFLFAYWPSSRIPFLDRGQSLGLLRGVNALVVAELLLSRVLPKLWAYRVATTWSRRERERFKA